MEAGALISYGFDLKGLFYDIASYVQLLAAGCQPSDKPLEQFVRALVNVIVANYAIATTAAMAATQTIPIVMVHGAPLQLGAIDSLARPGENVTGLSMMDAEIGGKRVQLLRELIPNLSRIAVLATTPTNSPFGPPF